MRRCKSESEEVVGLIIVTEVTADSTPASNTPPPTTPPWFDKRSKIKREIRKLLSIRIVRFGCIIMGVGIVPYKESKE